MPCPAYNVPRWVKLNRRNGPMKEVAKRTRVELVEKTN
jgi:hypothetical protein